MMAVISISQDDVIDVEFETVVSGNMARFNSPSKAEPKADEKPPQDQLSILRDQFSDPRQSSQPDELSPLFLAVTLICAFIVFWVSGGHALLY